MPDRKEKYHVEYYYDRLDRLTECIYYTNDNGEIGTDWKYGVKIPSYDLNGNINQLKRQGKKDDGTFGLVDNLTLKYTGNQLKSVSDYAEDICHKGSTDFKDGYNSDVEYVEVDSNGRLDLKQLEEKLSQNTFSYVSITGASNVTGYINPINSIAKIVHRYGSKLIVDGAQLVPHRKINMTGNHPDESIDFLVFSAHKMYAPYGVGVIVGLSKELNTLPFLKGGGAVKTVSDSDVIWKPAPERHEAGTQNFLGIVALTASIDMIKKIGYNHIVSHENYLRNYLIRELRKIPNVILYGDYNNIDDRLGVISFNIKDKDYDYVSHKLADDFGIATRYGKFCAHPYVNRLLNVDDNTVIEKSLSNEKSAGMIRLSLGLYNTLCEAKCVVNAISYIANN